MIIGFILTIIHYGGYFFYCFFSNGEGLWIDGELSKGRSTRCDTFNNKPLTSNMDGDFTITRVDVFSFQ